MTNGLVDQQFFARLTVANEQFGAGLPAMLERLAASSAAFDPHHPASALAAELQAQLHTMAGAAATFGFPVLGQQLRALEQRLRMLMVFETVGADAWRRWLGDLDALVAWGRVNPRSPYYSEDLVQ
jgi:HPt (histidine-containing phosphotransfer) domain-containing protein